MSGGFRTLPGAPVSGGSPTLPGASIDTRVTVCGVRSPSGSFVCNKLPHRDAAGHARLTRRGEQTVALATWGDGRHEEVHRVHVEGLRVIDDPQPAQVEQVLGGDTPPIDDPQPRSGVDELAVWWFNRADDEIKRTVPKAVEYGATDLSDLGTILARIAGRSVTSEQEAAELGIYFYIEGKLARWRDAILSGRQVSDDTLFDIGVYVRMAQRVRSHGGWPGTEGAK